MPSVNEDIFDATVRHQVFLQRYGGATVNRVIKLVAKAEADIVRRIRTRLTRLGPVDRQRVGAGLVTSKRLQRLLEEIRTLNHDLHVAVGRMLREELIRLADVEVDIALRRLDEAIGVDLGNLRPSPDMLRATVTAEPFRGRLLREFVNDLERDTIRRLKSTIQLGMVEGRTTPQIIRDVRNDLGLTKRKAELLVRTSTNHIANRARELFYQRNADIIKGLRWTSALDSRVSPICRARDGKVFPLDKGPRPPAHISCRSIMSPITKSWSELSGQDLDSGRSAKRIDELFEQRLKAQGFGPEAIKRTIRGARASMNGQVPGKLTYQTWLKRQPAAFQNEVLGPTRGALFRRGDLTVDKFVDMRSGRPFTLDELARTEGTAFKKAGLDRAA